MIIYMKAIGKMIKNTEKEDVNFMMEVYMMENGVMVI